MQVNVGVCSGKSCCVPSLHVGEMRVVRARPCRMNSSAPKSSMHFMARLFPSQLRAREHYRSMLILIALPSFLPLHTYRVTVLFILPTG